MILPLFFVLGQLGVNGALAFAESRSAFDSRSYATSDIINKDVAIIGGGSAGTYTAIRLKDLGKDVIVIEKDSILGGHTDTYSEFNFSILSFTVDEKGLMQSTKPLERISTWAL